jgi:hypothetical protein
VRSGRLVGPIPVRSLPYDGESLRLEQCRGRLSERLVVVDDENRRAHAPIVAEAPLERIGASRNREGEVSVPARTKDCG